MMVKVDQVYMYATSQREHTAHPSAPPDHRLRTSKVTCVARALCTCTALSGGSMQAWQVVDCETLYHVEIYDMAALHLIAIRI
eukprot:IDg13143t1